MKKLFIIGGMGAGKTTASQALSDQGIPVIDLDKVGHEILSWDVVKDDLCEAFGSDILDNEGNVIRSAVAAKAFKTPADTRKLNRVTMPRIEERYTELLKELEESGAKEVVVEYSAFKNRAMSIACQADIVIAILAPTDLRIKRAVASGFTEEDVRRRIARQITDADRIGAADVVFNNDSTPEELYNEVLAWWNSLKDAS